MSYGSGRFSTTDSVTGLPDGLKSTDDALHTLQQGGVWDYGSWPAGYYSTFAASLAVGASGTVVYDSGDITNFNGLVLEVATIGGTTPKLSIDITLDGTNYAAALPEIINLADNAVIAGATGIIAAGLYALNTPASAKVKYKGLRITQTGGAADQSCTLRGAHVWA